MSTNHDAIQGTIVLGITVVGAGLNGTLDALIGLAIHMISSFNLGSAIV